MVRASVPPVWHHTHFQVGDSTSAVPVALDSDLVLQPFERTVVKAKVVTTHLESLVFQNVMLNVALADVSLQNVVFLEDCVATVSETGHVFISVMNLTSNPQRIRSNTHLGTVVLVSLVYRAIPQRVDNPKPKIEVDEDQVDFFHEVYEEINLSTDSQLPSSSEFEFLSSTDPTEEGLSYREKRKRTDLELMAPIPEPASQLLRLFTGVVLELVAVVVLTGVVVLQRTSSLAQNQNPGHWYR